jgi:prevent-host-death family protein
MVQVPLRELNQHTAQVLARVEHGEILEITSRGRPIARIVPIAADSMADLVAAGSAVPPTVRGPFQMPTVAEGDVEAGELLSALRDEERW